MVALNIPERFKPALKKVASLSDNDAAVLQAALERLPVVRNPEKAASRLASHPGDLTTQDVESIIAVLGALASLRANLPVSPSKFVDELCEGLLGSNVVEEDKGGSLKRRLLSLLDTESVVIGAKAREIQREHQNVFMGARVYSDLRPVFSGAAESIAGAVVVHNFRLAYMYQNEPCELYVAMDDEDLDTLQKVIARAQAKSKTMTDLMRRAEIIDLGRDDEN